MSGANPFQAESLPPRTAPPHLEFPQRMQKEQVCVTQF